MTTYTLTGTEQLALNAQGLAGRRPECHDGQRRDHIRARCSARAPSRSFPPGASGSQYLGLTYEQFETTTATGTGVVIDGTEANDHVTVSAAGVVSVTNDLGYINTVDVSGYTTVSLNLLGGDDDVTNLADNNVFALTVVGGEQGTADRLTESNVDDVTVNLSAGTLTGTRVAGGTFSTTVIGVERVDVIGVNDAINPNAFTVTNYGAASDVRTLNLNTGDDAAANDNDTVDVSFTAGPDTVTYTPTSATSGSLTVPGGTAIHVTNFNNVAGGLTVDGLASQDSLAFIGTPVTTRSRSMARASR